MTEGNETPEHILGRIQKLLALGAENNGATPAERENAMLRAQELLLKYNLEITQFETRRGVQPSSPIKNQIDVSEEDWKSKLLSVLARCNFCRIVRTNVRRKGTRKLFGSVDVIGRAENVQSVTAMFLWLVNQLELACVRAELTDREPRQRWTLFREGFMNSAVYSLEPRLDAQFKQQQQEASVTALVVSHKAANEEFVSAHYGELVSTKYNLSGGYQNAKDAGFKAGQTVKLRPDSNQVSGSKLRALTGG